MSGVLREYVVDLSNVPVRSSEGLDCLAWLQGLPVLEPIIRCKDCKYGKAIKSVGCLMFNHTESRLQPKDPDGFCAWAERRDA